MQLIPAIAMVRFHRLLRLASNRRSPTRKDHRFESGTLHSHGALLQVRHFSYQEKDESHRGFSTRTRTIFRCASRSTWFFALNERSPTRKQVGSTPARSTHTGRTPWERHFPCKGNGESLLWLPHSSAENFLSVSTRCPWWGDDTSRRKRDESGR